MKFKKLFTKEKKVIDCNEIDSIRDSMKKIFIEGVKLALKIALEKVFEIGMITDIFDFGINIKSELKNIYENSKILLRNQNKTLIMEH